MSEEKKKAEEKKNKRLEPGANKGQSETPLTPDPSPEGRGGQDEELEKESKDGK